MPIVVDDARAAPRSHALIGHEPPSPEAKFHIGGWAAVGEGGGQETTDKQQHTSGWAAIWKALGQPSSKCVKQLAIGARPHRQPTDPIQHGHRVRNTPCPFPTGSRGTLDKRTLLEVSHCVRLTGCGQTDSGGTAMELVTICDGTANASQSGDGASLLKHDGRWDAEIL